MRYIFLIDVRYLAPNSQQYIRNYVASLDGVSTTDAIQRVMERFRLHHTDDAEIVDIRCRRQDNSKEWIIEANKFSDMGF